MLLLLLLLHVDKEGKEGDGASPMPRLALSMRGVGIMLSSSARRWGRQRATAASMAPVHAREDMYYAINYCIIMNYVSNEHFPSVQHMQVRQAMSPSSSRSTALRGGMHRMVWHASLWLGMHRMEGNRNVWLGENLAPAPAVLS